MATIPDPSAGPHAVLIFDNSKVVGVPEVWLGDKRVDGVTEVRLYPGRVCMISTALPITGESLPLATAPYTVAVKGARP